MKWGSQPGLHLVLGLLWSWCSGLWDLSSHQSFLKHLVYMLWGPAETHTLPARVSGSARTEGKMAPELLCPAPSSLVSPDPSPPLTPVVVSPSHQGGGLLSPSPWVPNTALDTKLNSPTSRHVLALPKADKPGLWSESSEWTRCLSPPAGPSGDSLAQTLSTELVESVSHQWTVSAEGVEARAQGLRLPAAGSSPNTASWFPGAGSLPLAGALRGGPREARVPP